MNHKIKNEVIDFIIEELGIGENEVLLNSDLLRDFGIDGDDGYEFIMKFNKKFNPKVPLLSNKYFNPEYFSIKAIFKKNKPLKVIDLINAIEKRIICEEQ